MDPSTLALVALALLAGLGLGLVAGQRLGGQTREQLRADLQALSAQAVAESSRQILALADNRVQATAAFVDPVRETLERVSHQLTDLERSGSSWQAQLKQQVESIHLSGEELRRETRALSGALRRPQVRGHWGEMQLKRSLELAGLTAHCAFDQQVTRSTADGILRPDVVVSLPAGKQVVIDAKVSLDAVLTAGDARTADDGQQALAAHARQVRHHIDQLAAKAYWQQFAPAPEFVVMFMPGEAIFAQALDTDPTLLDHAASRKVMLATPTTLIAMLRTIAYAWSQETLADSARELQQVGRELYDRIGKVAKHLDALGGALDRSVASYNATVGSLETRVLVTARRMRDLHVSDDELPSPRRLTEATRPLAAAELVGQLDEPDSDRGPSPVVVGAPGREQWVRNADGA